MVRFGNMDVHAFARCAPALRAHGTAEEVQDLLSLLTPRRAHPERTMRDNQAPAMAHEIEQRLFRLAAPTPLFRHGSNGTEVVQDDGVVSLQRGSARPIERLGDAHFEVRLL